MRDEVSDKIAFLERFQADIRAHFAGDGSASLRTQISRSMPRAKGILMETGTLKSVTLSPPPAIGGLMVQNADPFGFVLQDYYGMSMIPAVADMIDEAIGVLESPEYEKGISAIASRHVKANHKQGPPPGTVGRGAQPSLPEKVTISWLIQHVPVSFYVWLAGLLATAFLFGVQIGKYLQG